MASPAIAAKSILVDASAGEDTPTADWSIHVSKMPASPARAIAIFDTGGTNEGPHPSLLLDYRTFQVQVRGNVSDYALAYARCALIKDVLLGMTAQTVMSDRWNGVTMMGDITFLHRDENDMPVLVMNFRAIIEPADNATTQREPL
jgi:hypothetical protein